MLFNSLAFILLFLPTVLVLFQLAGSHSARIRVLLAASIFFYGWWNPIYVPLLLLSVLANYGFGWWVNRKKSVALLLGAITFNIVLIGYFKYAEFIAGSVYYFLDSPAPELGIVLPLAISFYTFQQISFVVDCYYRRTAPGNLVEYATFVTFFPQLIAGPVVRHTELAPQLRSLKVPQLSQQVTPAMTLFTLGLFKKVGFADALGFMNRPLFDAATQGFHLSTVEAWWAVSTYTLQLYFDFSGYSDMAVGLALFFGFRLPINFRSPYQATSILGFWNRWHITLTGFFTQYLYFPLSLKFRVRTIVGHSIVTFFVMGIVGLWHGAGWNFLIWGAVHGFYMVAARVYAQVRGPLSEEPPPFSIRGIWGRLKVFVLLSISYPFFRLPDYDSGMSAFCSLFGFGSIKTNSGASNEAFAPHIPISVTQVVFFVFLLAILWWAPSARRIAGLDNHSIDIAPQKPFFGLPLVLSGLIVGGLLAISLFRIFVGYESEFLYFQF